MEEIKKVYWLIDSEEAKPYETQTFYRCVGIEEFVKKVEKENKIVGIIFEGNNLGFVLDENSNDQLRKS